MTLSIVQAIELIQERANVDPVRALQLLNEANVYLTSRVRLVPDTAIDVTLVAGVGEYALDDAVCRVWDAAYVASPQSLQPLRATNVDSIFEEKGAGWQNQAGATPECFYERGGFVGFDPAPSVGTTAGYPKVTLYATRVNPLTLAGSLPTLAPSPYPWVYRALLHVPGQTAADVEGWLIRFHRAVDELQQYVHGRVPRDRPRVGLRIARLSRA